MKVLVIGGGGREHAMAWKISQSPRVDRVFVAPGNVGTFFDAENVAINPLDFPKVIQFAKENNIELVAVGPEQPLCAGIVDALKSEGLRVFGPSKAAAQLEGSKIFCKNMLKTGLIPTADFATFTNANDAMSYLKNRDDMPVVVKADGLAAGKGVYVCDNREQAIQAVQEMTIDKKFGMAGERLVIEERLDGQEASVLAITNGKTILTLPPCQDHKPAFDGDKGPNTGGMGAYCPAPLVDAKTLSWIEENILVRTVHVMNRMECPFSGVLYAGLMIGRQGVKVLEYNTRFGDPECQPLLMRLKTDLVDVMEATIDRQLDKLGALEWDPRPTVGVVMASDGYPGKSTYGFPISGLDEVAKMPDVKVFHSGTQVNDKGEVVNAGGRVLTVTAFGESIAMAKKNAYEAVRKIRWERAWCRHDIADKAIALEIENN
ncbi:MAG: phosphoribosylamine--glycine ligase [Thermoguttaceae bacterium]|nr:phosphoribosylamine--glycine ligase [Thermoguttaceae bacterium]